MIVTLLIERQFHIERQIFQWHMTVSNPVAFTLNLNIVACIDFTRLIRQIAGDGLHYIAQRDHAFHRTKLIDHKGEVSMGLTKLFQCLQHRQPFRKDQRLSNQGA